MRRTSPRSAALFAITALVAVLLPAPMASAASDYEAVIDLTFPVAGENRYIDDYDQSRGGGTRRHKATDIMASYGQTVHAAVGGTITLITGLDGNPPGWGYAIFVAGDDGRTYRYIHLGRQDGPPSEAYAEGMAKGVRVERGQHIGYNGHSGNASASWPHLHFEIRDPAVTDPYGTNQLNPYASLRAAEERGDLPLADLAATSGCGTSYAFAGDWDASGRDGLGWWCDGAIRLRTADGEVISYDYGRAGDVPIVADWNGDGRDTVSIVRDGTWLLNDHLDGGSADRSFVYGRVTQGDVPIAGDWNGDGFDTVGIIRDGEWHLRFDQAGGPGEVVFTYGRITRGDRALIGDWNGDGADTIGIVREGEWHLRHSLSGGPGETVYVYGRVTSGDTPVMGDWTGDGIPTPGIVRGDDWHLRHEHAAGYADQTVTFATP